MISVLPNEGFQAGHRTALKKNIDFNENNIKSVLPNEGFQLNIERP